MSRLCSLRAGSHLGAHARRQRANIANIEREWYGGARKRRSRDCHASGEAARKWACSDLCKFLTSTPKPQEWSNSIKWRRNMKSDSNVDSSLTVANICSVKWSWQAYTTYTIRDICTLTVLRSVFRPFMSLHSCLWRALIRRNFK